MCSMRLRVSIPKGILKYMTGMISLWRPQHSGISYGNPCQFLFVMIMIVIMADARRALSQEDAALYEKGDLADLLYADDTLLLRVSAGSLERYLAAFSKSGTSFGLELHSNKYQFMQIRTEAPVCRPDGVNIEPATERTFWGAVVTHDGRVPQELGRRIGMGKSDFWILAKAWNHSSLSQVRKLDIYKTLVLSRLLYGLATAWLNTSERRRSDGFHYRYLRTTWGIKPAFLSIFFNKEPDKTPFPESCSENSCYSLAQLHDPPKGMC